jgi:hypothetical protein
MRNKPGIISNHARGLATDLSYRWQPQKRGRQDGRKVSRAYINKLLQNADTLGIQLVIDYAQRSVGVAIVAHGKFANSSIKATGIT